jgi:hypothetical protein
MAGQNAARPTLLVVSLVRLGVPQNASQLRRRLNIDLDCGVAPSGHLFAIAANQLGDPHFDYSSQWFGVRDTGPLSEAGILRDHDEIAGMVFLETEWSKNSGADKLTVRRRRSPLPSPSIMQPRSRPPTPHKPEIEVSACRVERSDGAED